MIGKERRLKRLFIGEKRRCLLSPLDHASWLGPVKGIHDPREIVSQVTAGGANALLIGPGFYRQVGDLVSPTTAVVLRLSLTPGLASDTSQETPIAGIRSALSMDADAVAVSVFFGRSGDVAIYRWLGKLVEAAQPYGVPVVAEMMPPEKKSFDAEAIAHAARIGVELGADVIKTNYCGEVKAFRQITEMIRTPIIVAGGPKGGGDDDTLSMVKGAMEAGAAGVAIGRRVWQAEDPQAVTAQMAKLIFG